LLSNDAHSTNHFRLAQAGVMNINECKHDRWGRGYVPRCSTEKVRSLGECLLLGLYEIVDFTIQSNTWQMPWLYRSVVKNLQIEHFVIVIYVK